MSVELIIAGTSFDYPTSGDDPNWSTEASGWALAVTQALNTLLAPGDILQTTFTIENNISIPTNVNGLLFDSGTVRAANVNYAVYRTSISEPSGFAETGTLYLIFDDSAAVGQKWKMTQQANGTSGVSFTIGDNGQIQYISSAMDSAGYMGVIRFSARVLNR